MSSPVLQATALRFSYGSSLRVEVDALTVDRGEVLCLLGPSGSGKSTLLRLLGQLEKPQSGSVRLDGSRVEPRSLQARRRIAMALQAPTLFRGTVRTNVEYGLRLRGVPRQRRRGPAMDALSVAGLAGSEGRRASELSGGESQRVALARALAVSPGVLLLDEPLAHIDEPEREVLAARLRRHCKETGSAVVWVTHDRTEALSISDRVSILIDGKLRQTGPPMEVFSRPADEHVARFVGTENVLEGSCVSSSAGLVRVDLEGGSVEVAGDLTPGGTALVMVRPEDVAIWTRAPEGFSPRNRFRGVVEEVNVLGAIAKLRISGPITLVAMLTRPALEELGIRTGMEIWAGFKATSAHVVPRP